MNLEIYELEYNNVLIGILSLDINSNQAIYRVNQENIDNLENKDLILNFLLHDISTYEEILPFFESRISNMKKFNLNELSYPTDNYKLRKISTI